MSKTEWDWFRLRWGGYRTTPEQAFWADVYFLLRRKLMLTRWGVPEVGAPDVQPND